MPSFAYTAVSVSNVRLLSHGLCLADVRCVDEHEHPLEVAYDVLCSLSGFVQYPENVLPEDATDEEWGYYGELAKRYPGYDVYNEDEFPELVCRELRKTATA